MSTDLPKSFSKFYICKYQVHQVDLVVQVLQVDKSIISTNQCTIQLEDSIQ